MTIKNIISLITFSILFINCENKEKIIKKIKCENCLVTGEKTALKIALAVLYENYGEDKIQSEKPYKVTILKDSVWNIRGTFNGIGFGGVFNIQISSKDGKILDMYHEK